MGNICDRRLVQPASISEGGGGPSVLWLHGLGDTGAGWKGAFPLSGIEFHHPTAPTRPVTCNYYMPSTSWFDIQSIPVELSEPENPRDIDDSVASVHKMLDDLQNNGTPANQIVLGGFSQGGTVSLLAGLSYPKTLGGIISISGWCAKRREVSEWISPAGKQTPVLMCCGDGDPVVSFSITKRSADQLKTVLGDRLEVLCPKRGMHQPGQQERQAVFNFMSRCLQ